MKKDTKIKIILIISFLLILMISIFVIYKINNSSVLDEIVKTKIEKEKLELFSYIVYDNQDKNNIKTLVTVNTENGVDYIEKPNGAKIYGNGKSKIQIDYIAKENEENLFKIKEISKDIVEQKMLITDEVIKAFVSVEKISENTGYKTIEIKSNPLINGYKIYYQIGKNGQWQEGSGKISIVDYDVTVNNLINEDETITISAKVENSVTGDVVSMEKNYAVDTTSTIQSFEAESLIDAMERYDFGIGKFKVTVSDETYNLKVYSFEENQIIETNMSFGTEEDVATASEYAQNMVVLKVNGDLTIEQGKTLTAYASKNGYGGPKGMMIYCTGTLTNKGTISMTARGAKAEGQNVYLWKNEDGTYEYVPAQGGSGAAGVSGHEVRGKSGANGTGRQTGGGGSGGCWRANHLVTGKGAAGTSYSGGTGGSNAYNADGSGNSYAGNGEINGGAGGINSEKSGGRGAGNPSGGTGGLLIIYANAINNQNTINSKGTSGTYQFPAGGGGSSGGGSINIFYKSDYSNSGVIQATGGSASGANQDNGGGAGGTGSISIGNISTGTYESVYKNY